jgi:hypothetical protein
MRIHRSGRLSRKLACIGSRKEALAGQGVSHVIYVTELERLLDELVLAGDVRRSREDDGEQDKATDQRKNAENTDLREGVGALTEYLRHRFWAARPRGERQIRGGRFCAPVTSRGLYHSCEKRIKEAKGLGFLAKLPPARPAGGVECHSTRFLR